MSEVTLIIFLILIFLVVIPLIIYCFSHPYVRKFFQALVFILGLGGWVYWIGMLIYWHTVVEPSLDGSEGAGPGFGYVYVHFFLPIAALVATIYAMFLDALLEHFTLKKTF